MNLEFLQKLAKKNPAIARLIELSIYSGLSYALTAISTGELLSTQALIIACITPIASALAKFNRDLDKSSK